MVEIGVSYLTYPTLDGFWPSPPMGGYLQFDKTIAIYLENLIIRIPTLTLLLVTSFLSWMDVRATGLFQFLVHIYTNILSYAACP